MVNNIMAKFFQQNQEKSLFIKRNMYYMYRTILQPLEFTLFNFKTYLTLRA